MLLGDLRADSRLDMMYMPDAISSYTYRGRTYIVTANEGDSRDYDGFSEEERVEDLVLDPTSFPDAATLQMEENLGRLKTTNVNGDTDGDGWVDAFDPDDGGTPATLWDTDGDGVPDLRDTDADADGDGVGDVCDPCPLDPAPPQGDADGDGIGDACDSCINDANDDADADGLCADVDNCPADNNPGQADADADGLGDACDTCSNDPDNDIDGDGDQDALSASIGDDRIAWYENRLDEPSADFGSQQTISTAADGAVSVAAADIDGDGHLDLAAAPLQGFRRALDPVWLDEGRSRAVHGRARRCGREGR